MPVFGRACRRERSVFTFRSLAWSARISFFDRVPLTMYATQSSRFGVPRHATVTPLNRRRRRPSTFASGFRLPSIVALTSGYAAPVGVTEEPLDERRSSLANLTSVAISVSRLRLSAKNARARPARGSGDRKSTRLNSSHGYISYAVFCLKKKKINKTH